MKTDKKGMNTYVRYTLILILSICIGGAAGVGIMFFKVQHWGSGIGNVFDMIRDSLLPILLVITLLSVAYGEIIMRRIRILGRQLPGAQDEEADSLEFEMAQVENAGVIGNNIFSVLSILILSTGYSFRYIESLEKNEVYSLIISFFIFIVSAIYQGFWQLRYVKLMQKAYPDKKGDPSSGKFRQQWLESCDEAERQSIYQGAYQAYITVSKILPTLVMIAMIAHLLWDTGIFAVFMIGVVWITMTVTYSRACLKKKGQKPGISDNI